MHLGAVDGDHPDAHQAGLGAEREHLAEQPGQRRLVALAEPRDRRVIRALVGADHPRGDVLDAAALDAPRRALADRVAVEQQRDHHRRIVRRPALAVVAVGRVERLQIQRRDGVDDEPREMTLGQPLAQARRQQQLLITITREEVLRHPGMVLTRIVHEAVAAPSGRGRGTVRLSSDSAGVRSLQHLLGRFTLKVQRDGRNFTVDVAADGEGLVSHAGAALLGEVADRVGLTREFSRCAGGGARAARTSRSGPGDPGSGGDARRRRRLSV